MCLLDIHNNCICDYLGNHCIFDNSMIEYLGLEYLKCYIWSACLYYAVPLSHPYPHPYRSHPCPHPYPLESRWGAEP
jgi:hypothetical protein